MATITTNFITPTTAVPANFSVNVSPTEVMAMILELGPLFANSTGLRTQLPTTFALFNAMQVSATLTAASGSQPTTTTVNL